MIRDPKLDRTPMPVDWNKLPSYLRPNKLTKIKRSQDTREREVSSNAWSDYFAQYEGNEL